MKLRRGWLRLFLDPDWSPLAVLAGAVLLGLISEAGYELLKRALGEAAVVLVAVLGTLALILLGYSLYERLLDWRVNVGPVQPHRGLIVLVSHRDVEANPALSALRFHFGDGSDETRKTGHCYLVSDKRHPSGVEPEGSSFANAEKLRSLYRERLATCEIIEVSAEDCEDIQRQSDRAWRLLRMGSRLPASEIIADVTGGTKRMTIGLVLSAMGTGCKLEYLQPRRVLPSGQPDAAAGWDPQEISLRFFLRRLGRQGADE